MSYYPPQGSYVPQPVAYSSSHHGHGYETYPASQAQYASGYYAGQPTYATSAAAPVVIAPSSSRRSHRSHRSHRSRSPSRSRHGHGHSHSRRHHRHHSSTPQVISTGGSTVAYVCRKFPFFHTSLPTMCSLTSGQYRRLPSGVFRSIRPSPLFH